ncbi:MAG TPA: discoidin domain-containing protein, partial [Bacteroidota bacterium]|nr:discoidin domain-containing protein [Bacteroidota bacterium]
APGTQFKSYCDGVYMSTSPLGDYTVAPENPCSSRPEGFIAGAGHSSTFQDLYGNYWHVSTMTISQKHMFERRLGLFPMFFDEDGDLSTWTGFGDFPFVMPRKKITGIKDIQPTGMLLSYKKPLEVSSEASEHPKTFASDEDIRTYWSAKTGEKGEWVAMDLQKPCTVTSVQINFAEHETQLFGRSPEAYHQYLLEYSSNNKTWRTLEDKRRNTTDVPHDYIELRAPVKARYIRLTNYHMPTGTFALADLRVFGHGGGKIPAEIRTVHITRSATDKCVATLKWEKHPDAIGVMIRYGTRRDHLYHAYQVMDADSLTIRSLNGASKYYFSIDAFNENGIRKGSTITEVE